MVALDQRFEVRLIGPGKIASALALGGLESFSESDIHRRERRAGASDRLRAHQEASGLSAFRSTASGRARLGELDSIFRIAACKRELRARLQDDGFESAVLLRTREALCLVERFLRARVVALFYLDPPDCVPR